MRYMTSYGFILNCPVPSLLKMLKLIEIFLSIKGSCSECETKIHIYSQSELIGDSLILNISTFDSRGIAHKKKRQVRGNRRIRIGKELQGTSTYAWRRKLINGFRRRCIGQPTVGRRCM